jgi:hypothetical protein
MWPWNRQGTGNARLAELEQGFAKLQADTRAALREVTELSERAYKFLKRAEQRARRELDAPGESGAPLGAAPSVVTPPAGPSSPRAWGARGRRFARALQRGGSAGGSEGGSVNGDE